MGNATSSDAPREAHRLTKPRTYNHSPSPHLGTLSSLESDDVVWTSAGSSRTKQEARYHLRTQLFGPNEEDALSTQQHSDNGSQVLADLADNIDRLTSLSRPASNPSESGAQPTPTMPSAHEKRTVDLEAAIAILQELKKSATPDQLVALRTSLRQHPSPCHQVLMCPQLQTRPSSPPRMTRLPCPRTTSPPRNWFAASQWLYQDLPRATPLTFCAKGTRGQRKLLPGRWSSWAPLH